MDRLSFEIVEDAGVAELHTSGATRQSLIKSGRSGTPTPFEPVNHSGNMKSGKGFIGNKFNKKRFRVNVIYSLLITSIFLTILGAIATCREFRATHDDVFRPPVDFNVFRFTSFTLLAVTCSLAFITIIRKDKNNRRLLARLRSTNRNLENEVGKRATELAEAIKAKEHFLAIASHDLKAPINGILGLVELLKIEHGNRSSNESEYLTHIEYSCNKMRRLISDIIEINRIEQGQVVLRRQQVDLQPFLLKMKYDFALQAAKKNIDLILLSDISSKIETDPDCLGRVIENLLSNAIKFSPPDKTVSMRTTSSDEDVIFEIADQGPGIPLDEQPKLFNKFQKLSNRPTNSETSTGLGLSIVRQLTTQLGGNVTFRTEVGKGSTFVVRLPIKVGIEKG